MAREMSDLLARLEIIECDDTCVAGGSEQRVPWREGHRADWLDQPGEVVEKSTCVIGEQVDRARLVTGCCEATIRRLRYSSVSIPDVTAPPR